MKNTKEYAALNRGTLRLLLCFVLAFALVFSLLSAAIFAETATAADMRLQSTTGTVSLKNASGKSVSIREGMKLYSGYTLSTSSKSYAYVSLDSSKVVKLDASTKVQVKKSGSKLELLVSSGKLFFNVSAPLSSSETLNIRTSTMVTGVRGTSGVVSADGAGSSSVDIYDGAVTVNTVSGGESHTVTAGESLTVALGAAEMAALTEDDIPGFAAVEIAADESLQERIESASGLDVAGVVSGAQEKLASDEAEAEAAQAEADEAAEALNGGSVQLPGIEQTLPSISVIIPDFTDAPSPTDEPTAEPTTEPSTDPSTDPSDDPTDTPTAEPTPETGVFDSDAEIGAAEMQLILDHGSMTLNNVTLTIIENVDFDTSDFVINGSGSIVAASDVTLTISDSVSINGDLAFAGEVVVSGTLAVNSGATLTNNGYIELTNAGTITNNGTITNAVNSTMLIRTGCTVTNDGTITNNGWITTESEGAITGNAVQGNNQPVVSPPSGG